VVFIVILILTVCGNGGTKLPAVPSDYVGKTNPLGQDAAAAGKALYDERCASCHEAAGAGDGPADSGLDPKPANWIEVVKVAGDDFLFWRISESRGLAPFNSEMPAQKGILTKEQIWQVVTSIKSFK